MERLYGLIGRPVGHSRSAELFDRYVKPLYPDSEYRLFELGDIGELTELLAEWPEIEGFNVTSPYKEQIMPMLDTLAPGAEAIGAVNCVKVDRDGDDFRLTGHNTDCEGFGLAVARHLQAGDAVMVLGTGGGAKAVVRALEGMGHEAVTVSRTKGRGRMHYSDIDAAVMARFAMVVNATPACPADFPFALLTPAHTAYDLRYSPSVTEFMSRAAVQGAAVVNGLGMLEGQARASWRVWGLDSLL